MNDVRAQSVVEDFFASDSFTTLLMTTMEAVEKREEGEKEIRPFLVIISDYTSAVRSNSVSVITVLMIKIV